MFVLCHFHEHMSRGTIDVVAECSCQCLGAAIKAFFSVPRHARDRRSFGTKRWRENLSHRIHGVADTVIGDITKGVEREEVLVVRYAI